MEDTHSAPVSSDPEPIPTEQPSTTEPASAIDPAPEPQLPTRHQTMRMHEARWEIIRDKLSANWIGLRNSLDEMRKETDPAKWQRMHSNMKAIFADELFNMNGTLLGLFDDKVREKMSGITIEQTAPAEPLITSSR